MCLFGCLFVCWWGGVCVYLFVWRVFLSFFLFCRFVCFLVCLFVSFFLFCSFGVCLGVLFVVCFDCLFDYIA